jgi:hypothetical protein
MARRSNKVTSPKVAKIASKVLRNKNSSKISKTLGGSALSQATKKKK